MTLTSSYLLSLTTFAYLAAAFLYLVLWVFRVRKVGVLATIVTVGGFSLQTAGIILRWIESYQLGYGHRPPFQPLRIPRLFLLGDDPRLSRPRMADQKPGHRGLCHTFCLPHHGLCLLQPQGGRRDPAPHSRPPEQLAHRPCGHVLSRLRLLCRRVRPGNNVPHSRRFQGGRRHPLFSATKKGDRRPHAPDHHLRVPMAEHRDHHRGRLGQRGLGDLLELGPQRDLVAHHLVRLRHRPARAFRQGLDWKPHRLPVHNRIHLSDLHLFRCQLSPLWTP